jgi:tRNA nucleotidyltransferase/poly(A) polymerase
VQLGFEIESQTWLALSKEVKNLNLISGERISDELFKGLVVDPKLMTDILESSGVWDVLFTYLGKRSEILANKMFLLKGKIQSKGEAFVLLFLQSELSNKIDIFELESAQKIKWTFAYEDILKKINEQLKLSREDLKILRYLGAANCWAKNWHRLRPAFRYELLAMPENGLLADLLLMLDLDHRTLLEDLRLSHLQPQAFLAGRDVEKIDPKQRGAVLKECFYLQWEQKLLSRAEALTWLSKCTL